MDSQVKITYLGQCGFLIDFGHTRIVTDPYLSDYVDQKSSTDLNKWTRNYPPPTTLAKLNPDMILISHAHGDHLDPWTIQSYMDDGGKGAFVCPSPEVSRLREQGVVNVIPGKAETNVQIGNVTITPIPCAHRELHLDGNGDYHELSYFIYGNGICIFFGGDMSLYEGLYERLATANPNILLLPVNGDDEQRKQLDIIGNMDSREAAHLASQLSVPYIPMHHDLYEQNGCTPSVILQSAREAGAQAHILKPMEEMTVKQQP